jgi:hypothetical protein
MSPGEYLKHCRTISCQDVGLREVDFKNGLHHVRLEALMYSSSGVGQGNISSHETKKPNNWKSNNECDTNILETCFFQL